MFRKGSLNGKLVRTAGSPVMPIIDNNRNRDVNNRRGPEEIKAELLTAGLSSMKKTETMSRCNLSFSQAQKYTKILIGKGLLSFGNENGKQIIQTTPRGRVWLEHYKKMREIENGADLGNTSYIA